MPLVDLAIAPILGSYWTRTISFNEHFENNVLHRRVNFEAYWKHCLYIGVTILGLILGLRPDNKRRCDFVTASLFGWEQEYYISFWKT